jgi:hypothetical protein
LMKCSRRIRPIVSTVSIPLHCSLRIKASSGSGQGVDAVEKVLVIIDES